MSSCPSQMKYPSDLRELVLWKHKQFTGTILGAGLFFYFALFALHYSLLLLLCRVIQLAIIVSVGMKFTGKGFVPQSECVEKTVERFEKRARVTAQNVITRFIIPIVDPKDLTYVGKIFGIVTLVGMISSWFCTSTLLFLTFVGVFTIPFGYHENKEKVDPVLKQIMDQVNKTIGGSLSKGKPKST